MTPLVLALLLAAADAPFFQKGSRVGLVPPPGLSARLECLCFTSDDGHATIMTVEAPRAGYAQAEADGVAVWKRQGMADPKREDVTVDGRRALLISGAVTTRDGVRRHAWFLAIDAEPRTVMVTATIADDHQEKYRAADMRQALLNVRLRAHDVSLAEQVEALPFTVGDHGGFRLHSVLAGGAVMFTEGPADVVKAAEQPVVWVTLGLAGQSTAEGRAATARQQAGQASTLTGSREVAYEDYRREGADWNRLETAGAHKETGEAIRMVQVIRFHAGGFVIVSATLREADRERLTPRVLQLAHSIAAR